MQNGLHYPDNLYADHEEAKARRVSQQPTGAYRSTDPVTKPAHYQRAGIETIDYIRATLSAPGFEAYCIGNVLKYVSRYREKGGVEDLRKAQVYLAWAIEPDAPKRGSVVVHPPGVTPPGGWPRFNEVGHETMRVPKWDPAWGKLIERAGKNLGCGGMHPPNCDGLVARDIRVPHPMQAEVIRDRDERPLNEADKWWRDDNASGV